MHDFAVTAKKVLADAESRKAERLRSIDPDFEPEKYAETKAANPRLALMEVPLPGWKEFLRAHKPPSGSPLEKVYFALTKGAAGAGNADVVYVQAADVLALHGSASGPDEPTDLDD